MKADFKGGTKRCPKCRQEKKVEEYSKKNRGTSDGLCVWCKTCDSNYKFDVRLRNKIRHASFIVDNKTTKFCTLCQTLKLATEFSIHRSNTDGLHSCCKQCASYRLKNYHKNNTLKNADNKFNESKIKFCPSCNINKPATEFFVKRLTADGLDLVCSKCAVSRTTVYHLNRRKTDPLFNFKHNVCSLMRDAFGRRGFKKNSKSFQILGCSYEEFRWHLASQFQSGWTTENHGKVWHIDHIIPLATAKTTEDVVRLCHYTNLQPLSGPDNLRKGAKLDWKKA